MGRIRSLDGKFAEMKAGPDALSRLPTSDLGSENLNVGPLYGTASSFVNGRNGRIPLKNSVRAGDGYRWVFRGAAALSLTPGLA